LKGEASVSIRKGKKIISYDFNTVLKWEFTIKDGEGKEVGKILGEYDMPEISNDIDDDGDDWEVRSSVKEDKGNLKARFDNIIRKEAPNALRKAIKEQFVNLLK
jgi:activator of HSP90 ATPase